MDNECKGFFAEAIYDLFKIILVTRDDIKELAKATTMAKEMLENYGLETIVLTRFCDIKEKLISDPSAKMICAEFGPARDGGKQMADFLNKMKRNYPDVDLIALVLHEEEARCFMSINEFFDHALFKYDSATIADLAISLISGDVCNSSFVMRRAFDVNGSELVVA